MECKENRGELHKLKATWGKWNLLRHLFLLSNKRKAMLLRNRLWCNLENAHLCSKVSSLQSQHDELKKQHSDLEEEHRQQGEDFSRTVNDHKQKYLQLQREKEQELSKLKGTGKSNSPVLMEISTQCFSRTIDFCFIFFFLHGDWFTFIMWSFIIHLFLCNISHFSLSLWFVERSRRECSVFSTGHIGHVRQFFMCVLWDIWHLWPSTHKMLSMIPSHCNVQKLWWQRISRNLQGGRKTFFQLSTVALKSSGSRVRWPYIYKIRFYHREKLGDGYFWPLCPPLFLQHCVYKYFRIISYKKKDCANLQRV